MNYAILVLSTFLIAGYVGKSDAHPGHGSAQYHAHAYRLPDLPATLGEPQSWSSIKHRIKQETQLAIVGNSLNVRSVIYNGDRTRGRTMCTEVQVREQNGDTVASQVMRAGIKRRGPTSGTRTRTLVYSVEFPDWVDITTATAWVIDSYCPESWETRILSTGEKFVTKPVIEVLRGGGDVVRFIGKSKDQIINEISSSMGRIGGNNLQKAFDDIAAITRVVDDKLAVNLLIGVRDFVETKDFRKLDPITALGAAQIDSARASIYRIATPIPDHVIALMPEDYRHWLAGARYTEKKRVPELSAPHVGLSDARAIVMVDVIVFRDGQVLGVDTPQDRHLWLHEMFHVYQYKKNGTHNFTEVYLGDELGFEAADETYPGVNTIEANADLFACAHEPIPKPSYIQTCP